MKSFRSGSDDSGSLDLLLDTITNTLGGILFLAILLVLLTKASKSITDASRTAPAAEATSLNQQIAAAQRRIDQLEAESTAASALIESLGAENLDDAAADALASHRVLQKLQSERSDLEKRAVEYKQTSKLLDESERTLEFERRQLRERIDALESELSSEKRDRTEDLPLPRERSTSRTPFNVVLRYGRLYFNRRSSPGALNEANLRDFFEVAVKWQGRRYRVVTPKPWRGEPVLVDGKPSAAVRQSLQRWSARQFYPTVSAWDDSFAEARALRELFVTAGYEYRFIPVTEGDEIIEDAVVDARVQ